MSCGENFIIGAVAADARHFGRLDHETDAFQFSANLSGRVGRETKSIDEDTFQFSE